MKNFYLSKSRRLRSTPFSSRIERQGVKSYTVYNHMLLPTSFSSPEEEYKHLKENVQIWDVSVQREIEILGNNVLTKSTPAPSFFHHSFFGSSCISSIFVDAKAILR